MLEFNSLRECMQYLQKEYPQRSITLSAKQYNSTDEFSYEAPAFLYRGESNDYSKTLPSIDRLINDSSFPRELLEVIAQVTLKLNDDLQEFFNIPPMLSAGFLQHYGMPTDLLDFTSSLSVATSFASAGRVGATGRLCVLPMAVASRSAVVIDLTQHPSAERPRRQKAYAVAHGSHKDFKAEQCIKSLKLQWHAFKLTVQDKDSFGVDGSLLDAHTDKFAGVMQLLINNYGKINDWAANWISERVPAAPFLTRAIDFYENGNPRNVELIALEESGAVFNERIERINNYRRWSDRYTDTTSSGGFRSIEWPERST